MRSCMNEEVLWRDRKHHCGLPLSFETYAISSDRLFWSSGFLYQANRDILLYRVRDISLTCSFAQRLFGVGTVRVTTTDNQVITLENIRSPYQVKELLYENVEEQKQSRRCYFGGYHLGGYRICGREAAPWFADWL